MSDLHTYDYMKQFSCLGDKCEDTCCVGWSMQLNPIHYQRYEEEAPELLDAVEQTADGSRIMRKDPQTHYCVKFAGGLCSIHQKYGERFLGDACHFFPRITRTFGDLHTQAGSLSCPEIARLTLLKEQAFAPVSLETDRVPEGLKDYLPEGIEPAQASDILHALQTFVDESPFSAEKTMACLLSVALSLQHVDMKRWPDGISFLLRMSEGRLPEPEADPNDPARLLQAIHLLLHAAPKQSRPRLEAVLANIAKQIGVQIEPGSLDIMQNLDYTTRMSSLEEKWNHAPSSTQTILKRWIQAQFTMTSFPFAGFGENVWEYMMMLGIRFATFRLALMCHLASAQEPGEPDEEEVVVIAQSLSRFLDHLADPTLSRTIYTDYGWNQEPRLRALIGDA